MDTATVSEPEEQEVVCVGSHIMYKELHNDNRFVYN